MDISQLATKGTNTMFGWQNEEHKGNSDVIPAFNEFRLQVVCFRERCSFHMSRKGKSPV